MLFAITTVKGIGTFEKIVLQQYENNNKPDLFTQIEIHKFNGSKYSIRNDNDIMKINQLLNNFKKLTLLKSKGIVKDFLGTGKGIKYIIFFDNHTTKKHLIITLYENRIIKCSTGDYRILNSDSKYKIFLENINDIYNTLTNEVEQQN